MMQVELFEGVTWNPVQGIAVLKALTALLAAYGTLVMAVILAIDHGPIEDD